MNAQLLLLTVNMIREIASHVIWAIFLLFSFIVLKYKRFHLLGTCLLLLFCSIYIPMAERLVVSKSGVEYVAKKYLSNMRSAAEQPEKRINVFLTQEYPDFPGYSYQDSIDLSSTPAIMRWQKGEHAFWVGLGNAGKHNFSNPTIFLDFKGEANIRVDSNYSKGWVETDPNFTYVNNVKENLQPGMGFRLNPLYVTFTKKGTYPVSYTITGDDYPPIRGEFNIKVEEPQNKQEN